MLVHLAITLSTVHGWVLPLDDKASSLSSHESVITGGIDGEHARRQLIASGCSGSWSVCARQLPASPLAYNRVAFLCSQRFGRVHNTRQL